MEEVPPLAEEKRVEAQKLAQKMELFSAERMEKHFPGLKAEFDLLREIRADGSISEDAFWEWIKVLAYRHEFDEEKLNRILEGDR